MNGKLTRIGLGVASEEGRTDWSRLVSLTDEDIDRAMTQDDDAWPLEGSRVAKGYSFEITEDKQGEFRVAFKYNSEKIFTTEGYSSKARAKRAIESFRKNGSLAPVVDRSKSAA